jgi:hypothetical protein
MFKQTLQIVGSVILIAGLTVGSIGTYWIVKNLPISDAEALRVSRGALSAIEGLSEDPEQATLQDNVELQVWQSALTMTNKDRKERRDEGAMWLLSGIIAVIWGVTVLQYSRTALKEP